MICLGILAICGGWKPSIQDIVLEAIGYKSVLMKFNWYVPFYVFSMLIMKQIHKRIDHNITFAFVFGVILPCIAFRLLIYTKFPFIGEVATDLYRYFPCVSMGYICHRYNIFAYVDSIRKKIGSSEIVFSVICIVIALLGANCVPRFNCFSVALFVFGIANVVQKLDYLINKVLIFCGNHSANVWFLHCAISSVLTRKMIQPYVYWNQQGVYCFVTTAMVLFIMAFLFDCLEDKIFRVIKM